jgi:lipopolysaccharide export system protein LptC
MFARLLPFLVLLALYFWFAPRAQISVEQTRLASALTRSCSGQHLDHRVFRPHGGRRYVARRWVEAALPAMSTWVSSLPYTSLR